MRRSIPLTVAVFAGSTEHGQDAPDPYGYGDLQALLASNTSTFQVLPGLQALASTNVCWSRAEALFRTDGVEKMCQALPSPILFLEDGFDLDRLQPGVVLPSPNRTRRRAQKRHLQKTFDGYGDLRYCWNMHSQSAVDTTHFARVSGLTVLLTEHHGNVNIGHASRDASFLANLLHHREAAPSAVPPVQQVLVRDHQYGHVVRQGRRVMSYRADSLAALTRGAVPRGGVLFVGDPEANASLARLQGAAAGGVCFDVVVQRLRSWYFDHGLYRRKAWEFCGVPPDQRPDTILLEEHGHTRAWADREAFAEFVAAHKISRGLRVLLGSFSKASFCDQVQVFARTKVAIMHHGAGLANCAFLSPEAVCIEVEAACPGGEQRCLPFVYGTLFQPFFEVTGIRYVGARIAKPVRSGGGTCPNNLNYYYDPGCVVQVNYAGLDKVLQTAIELGAPWPDGNASLGVVDHVSLWPAAYAKLWPRSSKMPDVPSGPPAHASTGSSSEAASRSTLRPARNSMHLFAEQSMGSWGELLLVPALSCAAQLIIGIWWVCQRSRACSSPAA